LVKGGSFWGGKKNDEKESSSWSLRGIKATSSSGTMKNLLTSQGLGKKRGEGGNHHGGKKKEGPRRANLRKCEKEWRGRERGVRWDRREN